MPHRYAIKDRWALGDTVCLSALIRDIHKCYPGRFALELFGHYKSYWKHDPGVAAATDAITGQLLDIQYKDGVAVANAGRKIHFLAWFHRDFNSKTGLNVTVTEPKGTIFLGQDRLDKVWAPYPYWVVVAGGKLDITTKVWHAHRWQIVVDELRRRGIRCIQSGLDANTHFHPRLRNCDATFDKTADIADLFSLIRGAEGVLCGVTAAMHIAAAFDKPCVVVAGGREAPWWEEYSNAWNAFGPQCAKVKVPHRFLHTLGKIDCGIGNLTKGCWKKRTVPVDRNDLTKPDSIDKLCRRPIRQGRNAVPACLDMISAETVVDSALSYYRDGTLSSKGIDLTVPEIIAVTSQPPLSRSPLEMLPSPDELPSFAALDHPTIGKRITIFALGFGDHVDLLTRCVGSILRTVPAARRDLRIALNQPSDALRHYVESLPAGAVTKVYTDTGARRKYPAMREMFWDSDCPIETKYLCWFDDDSWCFANDWLPQLANTIILNHPQGCRMYGARYICDFADDYKKGFEPKKWFEAAPWWRNVWMHSANGNRTSPNGSQIVFASGGFWALDVATMRAADIPDVRLNHNGGDITIGCQLHQAGFRMKDFASGRPAINRKIVRWSDAPRRGYHEKFPWSQYKA